MELITIVTLAALGYFAYLYYLRHKLMFNLAYYFITEKFSPNKKRNFTVDGSCAIVTYEKRGTEYRVFLPYVNIPTIMKTRDIRLLVSKSESDIDKHKLDGKILKLEDGKFICPEGIEYEDMTQQKGIPYLMQLRYMDGKYAVSVILKKEDNEEGDYRCTVLNTYTQDDIPMSKEYTNKVSLD